LSFPTGVEFGEGFREKRVLLRDLPLYVSGELIGLAWGAWAYSNGFARLSVVEASLVTLAYAAGGGILAVSELSYFRKVCRKKTFYMLSWGYLGVLVILFLGYRALAILIRLAVMPFGATVNDLGPSLFLGFPAGWAAGTLAFEHRYGVMLVVRKGILRSTGRTARAYFFRPLRGSPPTG